MAFGKIWVIAYRDLGRNRRRSGLSLLAVALGLAVLIFMSGYIAGVTGGSLQNSIRLNTGHVQVRAEDYDEVKVSLLWGDLLQNTAPLLAQAQALPEVKSATPVLWASAILSTIDESSGLQVVGINPGDSFYQVLRDGLVAGQYLAPDDRGGILMGKRLADSLGVGVGQRVSIAVGQSEGAPVEGIFTIRGLFFTDVPNFDLGKVFMTLSQAQAFTGAGDRASAVVITLNREKDADKVAAALAGPGLTTLTWEEMHAVFINTLDTAMGFYFMIYGIVILVVAVIITNTLLMAVFERTREMGILAALGMKGRQITLMFLFEAAILALVGIVAGIALGSAIVLYLAQVGIPLGEMISTAASGIPLGTMMYTSWVPADIFWLSLWMLVIILVASLYPALFAARLEPVKALHAL